MRRLLLLVVSLAVTLVASVIGATGSAADHTGPPHLFSSASTGALSFATYRCEFTVPALPESYDDQSVFLWCGIQQAGEVDGSSSFGVIQPVVMYGPDCTSATIGLGPEADPGYRAAPYWYYSAQYVYPTSGGATVCASSPQGFRAEPGDVLVSTFTYDPGTDAVTVAIAQLDGSGESTFVATHPQMDPALSWAPLVGHMRLNLAIEAAAIAGPSSWPAEPARWPVAMGYVGVDPEAFAPQPVLVEGPELACAPASIAADTASAVCTYDLASTQPPDPLVPSTSTTTDPTDVAAVDLTTPSFTG